MEDNKKEYKLANGFVITLHGELLDDWDFLETLREIDKGNAGLIVDVMPMILGKEQFKALKDHMRDEKGKLKATDMVDVLYEILNIEKETKNS